MCLFGGVFKVFFKIIGNGGHEHAFVGLLYAQGIHFGEPHKLGKNAKNRFYGARAFGFHVAALFVIPFLNKKTYKALTVLFLVICIPIVFFQFNPIDTSTFPNDVKVLKVQGSYQQVVREQQNMKTLMEERDTVWVEDRFIFRRILK
ncbi:hypothetical protein SAMN05216480_10236 [Pustulibacterium marinum]|uniref:Uncharacterized protein n=1 Tax=Pustulibacterium marinum TaxID=1224947 RepID=A0A1I7FMT0_9FLAO|nr:hypothetical protein SAMN05216480_10236 [Pustulibacterium marinum]